MLIYFFLSITIGVVFYKYGFAIGSTFALGLANLVVLFVYTKETKLMRKESQLMREAQTEPHISVYLKTSVKTAINLRNLVISNDGMGNAKNIKLSLINKIQNDYIIDGRKVKEMPIFNKIIPQIVKNQKFEFFFISLIENKEFLDYEDFLINVYFESEVGKSYNLMYDISLNYEDKLGFIDDLTPVEKFFNGNSSNGGNIVTNLENINKSINTLIKLTKENNKVEA